MGVAGAGLLNPTPGGSPFTTITSAADAEPAMHSVNNRQASLATMRGSFLRVDDVGASRAAVGDPDAAISRALSHSQRNMRTIRPECNPATGQTDDFRGSARCDRVQRGLLWRRCSHCVFRIVAHRNLSDERLPQAIKPFLRISRGHL